MTCCGCDAPTVQALLLTQANVLITLLSVLSDITEDLIIGAMHFSAPWVAA